MGLLDFEDSLFGDNASRRKDLSHVTHRIYENDDQNDFDEFNTLTFTDSFLALECCREFDMRTDENRELAFTLKIPLRFSSKFSLNSFGIQMAVFVFGILAILIPNLLLITVFTIAYMLMTPGAAWSFLWHGITNSSLLAYLASCTLIGTGYALYNVIRVRMSSKRAGISVRKFAADITDNRVRVKSK